MQVVGIFLLIAAIWTIWAGAESINPLFLMLAILQNKSDPQSIITQAKALVVQTNASVVAGGTDSSGNPLDLLGTLTGGIVGGTVAGSGGGAGAGTDKASYQAYAAQQLASKYHITDPSQMQSLIKLWNQESGWNPGAVNSSSGAWGIAQILPSAHPDVQKNTNAQAQIDWGLAYIMGRYGSPNNAWQHEVANNWY